MADSTNTPAAPAPARSASASASASTPAQDPAAGDGLGTSNERSNEEHLRALAADAEAHRRNRRMRGKRSLIDLIKRTEAAPIAVAVAVAILVLCFSWGGYVYHVSYHKYFGHFTPHEQYLCREEALMLKLQKLMLSKAKKEISYLHGDAGSGGIESARKEKRRLLLKDPKHKIGPAHPTIDIHDHKQISKVKGLQTKSKRSSSSGSSNGDVLTDEDIQADPVLSKLPREHFDERRLADQLGVSPNNVFVSNDLGFYQFSYGSVNVEAETGSTMVGQSLGTHAKVGNGFSTLVYYRIWKNANDYIRGMMYQYQQKKARLDGVGSGSGTKNQPVCKDLGKCRHLPETRMKARSGMLHQLFFPAHLRRFPFTFVRHPLLRFVSGYTEIEYRYNDANTEHEWWKEKEAKRILDAEAAGYEETHSTEKSIAGAKKSLELQEKARKAKVAVQQKFAASKKHVKGNTQQARSMRSYYNRPKVEYDQHGTVSGPGKHLDKKSLPMKAKMGSAERFMEFIDLILLFDGSRRIFKAFDTHAEFAHIAPQVGTLFTANLAETLPIRKYRIEDFASEWKTLSVETGQPRLLHIRDALKGHKDLWSHPSSADEYNTTASASHFLSQATDITVSDLKNAEKAAFLSKEIQLNKKLELIQVQAKLGEATASEVRAVQDAIKSAAASSVVAAAALSDTESPPTSGQARNMQQSPRAVTDTVADSSYPLWLTLPEYRKPEVIYTRALCRIYLSDFICADYDLPAVCHDILEDVDTFTSEYESKERAKAWANRSLANTIFPEWLLYALAEIPCVLLADSPPSCIASFVHGESLEETDDYDEWGDQHEEL